MNIDVLEQVAKILVDAGATPASAARAAVILPDTGSLAEARDALETADGRLDSELLVAAVAHGCDVELARSMP